MDEAMKAELDRLRDENHRLNRRIEILEGMTKEIQALAISIHSLAKDMEQREQGRRLEKQDERINRSEAVLETLSKQEEKMDDIDKWLNRIEMKPANAWNDAKKNAITVFVSTIAGSLATGLIFVLSQSIR